MNRTGESAVRRRPRGIGPTLALASLLLLAVVGYCIIRSRTITTAPAWAEIERAKSRRRWAEMEEKLTRWIDANPEHGQARVMLADLRLGLGRRDEAVLGLSSVAESNPAWVQTQTMLGELAIRERQAARAEQIFRQVAAHDERALAPRQRLIYLFGMQQRTAEARRVLWEIYRIRDDPKVLVDLVLELLLDQEDVRGLAPELEQFVARTPEDPLLRRAWGMSLLYQGRPAEALPHLEAAATELMNDASGRFALAECRIMLRKAVDLEDAFGPKPRQPIDEAQWWLLRGRIEETTGGLDRAAQSLERSLALNQEDREAHFRLRKIRAGSGRA